MNLNLDPKESITELLIGLMSFIGIWWVITMFYQNYQCPEMTQMEVFKHSFHSFFLEFKECTN